MWQYIKIQFLPHREHNTSRYKGHPVDAVQETIDVYYEIHAKLTNTHYGQNAEFSI
jgi:hypothetical protein